MMQTSPICIARNHQVEAALAAAVERVDLALFERLLTVLSRPFDERADYADHAQPAPLEETTCYKTFCGT